MGKRGSLIAARRRERRIDMEKLTERLRYVLEDCIDCISPIQQEVINKAVDRLAAYEETGLEPEDIKRAFNEAAVLKLAGQALGITPDRLRELAQADKEGRCVVLPFKPPRWVYVCSTRFPKPAQAHYASAINVLQDMDKGCVFGDTQEEAAAALRREQDG